MDWRRPEQSGSNRVLHSHTQVCQVTVRPGFAISRYHGLRRHEERDRRAEAPGQRDRQTKAKR